MRALLPLLALPLAACASHGGDYPSLAPRPIELRSDAEPAAVPIVAAADPALDGKLAEATGELDAAAKAFEASARRIEATLGAARAGGVGSDAWINAQTALSDVDTARTRSTTTLTDLERLAIDRAAAGQPPYPALEAAQVRASEQASAQAGRYDLLRNSLPTP